MLTKEIIFDLMNDYTKGVDTYNHNGSTWLIFTDSKKWVIELTKEKTLWYNYYFFTGVFKYLSLDVVENQHYITKWVEDNVINGVKDARALEEWVNSEKIVDKTIQNGVKVTYSDKIPHQYDWTNQFTDEIEDIIENGVKHTEYGDWEDGDERLDDIIENGVKETTPGGYLGFVEMKGKKIHQFETAKQLYYVEDVIDSGIKKTEGGVLFDESKIDTVIIEGVKETKCAKDKDIYDPHTFQNQKFERERRINEVIQDGIKEVQPLPSQEGNKDWGDYYHRQEDRTKPHTQYVDDVILNGIKETVTGSDKRMLVENVLNNGIKLT